MSFQRPCFQPFSPPRSKRVHSLTNGFPANVLLSCSTRRSEGSDHGHAGAEGEVGRCRGGGRCSAEYLGARESGAGAENRRRVRCFALGFRRKGHPGMPHTSTCTTLVEASSGLRDNFWRSYVRISRSKSPPRRFHWPCTKFVRPILVHT